MSQKNQQFLFVVDTDSYAGNFERDMCAYLTGEVGECGVGQEYADLYAKEVGEPVPTLSIPDEDNGCRRPCVIYPTPGFFNDGMGNAWPDDADPVKVKRKYDKALKDYKKNYKSSVDGSPGRFPSYQSVAIYCNGKPSPENVALMKERARKFLSVKLMEFDGKPGKILGFRLVEEHDEHGHAGLTTPPVPARPACR